MLIRHAIVAALLGLNFSAQALAAHDDPFAQLGPQGLFDGLIDEDDVSLAFAYVRSAMFAAGLGLEPPPIPEELRQRAEALGDQLKARGALTALSLLNALEANAKRALRERAPARPAFPPAMPDQPAQD
jgi:hypothetical protein